VLRRHPSGCVSCRKRERERERGRCLGEFTLQANIDLRQDLASLT
jgi:hypothetical protein